MSQVRVVLKSVFNSDGIKQAEKAFSTIGKGIDNAFRVVAVASAAAGAAIGKFGLDSVRAASNLEESTNAVNVAFGAAAKSVLAIGETAAESLGLAQTEFNQAAVRFSAFSDRIVGSGGDVAGFITDISQRAADFASVFNIDVSEALAVFQSGLAGEAEPLKRFGINLLESEVKAFAMANGIGEVGKQLTETEKVQARYGLLMESTAKTQGDFANTSDGLANSQRILKARFTDVQAAVGEALLPAVTNLVAAFGEKLLPKLEELGAFLASSEGQKAIEDFAKSFEEFFTFIIDNFQEIAELAIQIALLVTGLKILKGAIETTTIVMAFFNTTVGKNPFVIAATLILTLAGAIGILGIGAEKAKSALDSVNMEAKQLETDLANLETAFNSGAISQEDFERQSIAIKAALEEVRDQAAFLNNQATLQKFRGQLGDTRVEAERLTKANRELFLAMGGKITAAMSPAVAPDTGTGSSGGGGGGASGPSPREQTQKIIQDAQKKLAEATKRHQAAITEARKSYNTAIFSAEKAFSDSIASATVSRNESLAAALVAHNNNLARIQADFATRQADIIKTSINRLRDAFAGAVRTDVGRLFDTDEVGKSVDGLVKTLGDRLAASRALIANSAALAAQGFSQTFIEQVVSAGLETGNELAAAILEATPETQGELKTLFSSLESTSETGMDSLAQTMFDKTGLATTELKRLFTQTSTDLTASLATAQTEYVASQTAILKTFDEAMLAATKTRDEAFKTANTTLKEQLDVAAAAYKDTVTQIKDDFLEQIGLIEGGLGGLDKTVARLLKSMDKMISGGGAAPVIPAVVTPTQVNTGGGRTTPAPVININVKTDVTQSPAMVGKVIVREVNKFVSGGGGVRGLVAI